MGEFIAVCVFIVAAGFGLTAFLVNVDETSTAKINDKCFTEEHKHMSWSFKDYTTTKTYCEVDLGFISPVPVTP